MTKFQDKLRGIMDEYVHLVYKVSRNFPREEWYGVVSQLRRAALSVVLNYIEGFARFRPAVKLNFFETAYGSLKESSYLLDFSMIEKFILSEDYTTCKKLADEIGAMLWTEIECFRENNSKKVVSNKYDTKC